MSEKLISGHMLIRDEEIIVKLFSTLINKGTV